MRDRTVVVKMQLLGLQPSMTPRADQLSKSQTCNRGSKIGVLKHIKAFCCHKGPFWSVERQVKLVLISRKNCIVPGSFQFPPEPEAPDLPNSIK